MRTAFRTVVLLLILGGWTLSAAALHVVRAPGRWVLFPKDRLSFHDTYVDTRLWTLIDVRTHPVLVARLVHLGHADLLAHTTDPAAGDPATQLTAATDHPLPEIIRANPHPLLQNIATRLHTTTDAVKAFFD